VLFVQRMPALSRHANRTEPLVLAAAPSVPSLMQRWARGLTVTGRYAATRWPVMPDGLFVDGREEQGTMIIAGAPFLGPNTSLYRTDTPWGSVVVHMSSAFFPRPTPPGTFFFAYRCRMWREVVDTPERAFPDEVRRTPITLLSRRWVIRSADDAEPEIVTGEGVIGKFPELMPVPPELLRDVSRLNASCVFDDEKPINCVFEYCSGTNAQSLTGTSIEGAFTFVAGARDDSGDGVTFDVRVNRFTCEMRNWISLRLTGAWNGARKHATTVICGGALTVARK